MPATPLSSRVSAPAPPLFAPIGSPPPPPVQPLRRRLLHAAAYATLAILGLVLTGVILDLTVRDPRGAHTAAARQLQLMVADGERVEGAVSVVQRHWWDRFGETRGVLAVTDRRIIFVGVAPRDVLDREPGPPVLDVHTFPVDTAVAVREGRVYFGLARGFTLETSRERETFALASGQRERLTTITRALERHRAELFAGLERERRAAAEAAAAAARPRIHVVQRGEALSSIARDNNTTPEVLRELNAIEGDRIRPGQRLIVGFGDTATVRPP